MATCVRYGLAVCVLCVAGMLEARAQTALNDQAKPVQKELSPRELERREAMKLYGLGLLCERDNRLLEACRHFEEAVKLDPQARAIHKSLIPLYLAIERVDDALAACRKTVELDPNECETWYLYGRLLKDQGKSKEAMAALAKALACPKLKDQPEFLVQIASDLGQMREEAKDVTGALAAYAEVLKVLEHPTALLESGLLSRKEIDAKAAEMYEHIGSLCLEARRFDQAADAFTRAQKKDPELAVRINYHLARVRLAQDQPADALKHLDEYLKTQPQATEPYDLKITLLQKLNRAGEIIDALKAHAENDAHNIDLQLLLARQYAREGKVADAEEHYKSIAREAPRPEVYRGLFQLYKTRPGQVSQVLDMLDKAIRDSGNRANPGAASATLSARAMLIVLRDDADLVKAILRVAQRELNGGQVAKRESWSYLAVLAIRTEQLEAAEQLYRACLDNINPGNEAEVYFGYVSVLQQLRKHEEVIKVCRKGLKEAHNSNRLYFHDRLARTLIQLDRLDEALAEAAEGVKIATDKNRVQFRVLHAHIHALANRFDKAIEECQAVLKDDASKPEEMRDARYALSGIYSMAKKHAQAEEQLRLILVDDPNDATANNDLGYIMADQNKNLDEAEKLIRKALQLDREEKRRTKHEKGGDEGAEEASEERKPKITTEDDRDHAAYVDSLGWVLFRKGQVEEARKELEKAVALPDGSDDPVVWDHLGDVYLRLNKPDQARTAWKKAEKLYEVDKRRKRDEQYKELKQKLKVLK